MVAATAAIDKGKSIEDLLADEAAELDGYFSDTPLNPKPNYPPLNKSFDSTIIITNLPKVPESKVEKLTAVVTKIVTRIGTLATNADTEYSGVHMPFDQQKGSTLGFCFVEYETPEEAKTALEVLADYNFDKNHSLSVTLYPRAAFLKSVEAKEFTEPEPVPFVEKPNPTSWLEDSNQRDSFFVRYDRETVVYWSDAKNDPVVDYDGAREKQAGVAWCEYYAFWSPKGSYMATLVPSKGVILWSGATYEKTARFPAPGVDFILFSPQENYLLTSNNSKDDPNAIKIFDVATGELLRTFPLYPIGVAPENGTPAPPFLWSHDDQYFARMGKDLISIFETATMKLLDKRSLSTDGINEFQWSPKANILAYWVSRRYFCAENSSNLCRIDSKL
jgi:translation initiation factor 3 subunit B